MTLPAASTTVAGPNVMVWLKSAIENPPRKPASKGAFRKNDASTPNDALRKSSSLNVNGSLTIRVSSNSTGVFPHAAGPHTSVSPNVDNPIVSCANPNEEVLLNSNWYVNSPTCGMKGPSPAAGMTVPAVLTPPVTCIGSTSTADPETPGGGAIVRSSMKPPPVPARAPIPKLAGTSLKLAWAKPEKLIPRAGSTLILERASQNRNPGTNPGPLDEMLDDTAPGPAMQRGGAERGNGVIGGSAANGSVAGSGSSTSALCEHTDRMEPASAACTLGSATTASNANARTESHMVRIVVPLL